VFIFDKNVSHNDSAFLTTNPELYKIMEIRRKCCIFGMAKFRIFGKMAFLMSKSLVAHDVDDERTCPSISR